MKKRVENEKNNLFNFEDYYSHILNTHKDYLQNSSFFNIMIIFIFLNAERHHFIIRNDRAKQHYHQILKIFHTI